MENRDNFKFGERLEYFPPQQDIRESYAKIKMQDFQQCVIDNWDKLKQYIEWDSPEATIKHYRPIDYDILWNKCRKDNVILLPKSEPVNVDSILNTLTKTELKSKFDDEEVREYLYKVIKYFVWYKKSHTKHDNVICKNNPMDDSIRGRYCNERFQMHLRIATYDNYLNDGIRREEKEVNEIKNAIDACNFLIYLFENPFDVEGILPIINNTLQYMKIKDLNILLKQMDKHFEEVKKGRRENNTPVYVFNKYGEMIKRYNNRQECMETEGLGKTYMSMLLSGKKRRNKCFYCEMTDEEYNIDEEKFKELYGE